jgi:hypothetical protein
MRCLESFAAEELVADGSESLCPACRAAAARPRAVPPTAVEEKEPGFLDRLREEAATWCRGRSWAVRVPLLVYFAYTLVRHWLDPMYQDWFKPLDLGIHELGHFVFAPLGRFMGIAGGSLTQCLLPVGSTAMFYRQRDWFAIAVCWGWLSLNLFDVATYAADARSMSLPLVSPGGGEVVHDWNYLLEAMGLLAWDGGVALLLRFAATASMLLCLAAGTWLLWTMARRGGSSSA